MCCRRGLWPLVLPKLLNSFIIDPSTSGGKNETHIACSSTSNRQRIRRQRNRHQETHGSKNGSVDEGRCPRSGAQNSRGSGRQMEVHVEMVGKSRCEARRI